LQTLREKVVALAPCCQVPELLSVGGLIIVGDETQDGGVVHELKDGVGAMCGYTVMRVQGVQEWAEYTALTGSSAQGQYIGGETAHSHHLGSAHQEVQDPVAKRGVKPRLLSMRTTLAGTIVLNAEL